MPALPELAGAFRSWLAASLARRMGAAAIAVTAVSMLAAGAGSYLVTARLLRESHAQRLGVESSLAAQALRAALAEEQRDLAELAANPLLANALMDSSGREQYAEPFLRVHALRPSAPRIALLDFQGEPMTALGFAPAPHAVGAGWLPAVVDGLSPQAVLEPGGALRLAFPVDYPESAGAEGVLLAELDAGVLVRQAATALPRGFAVSLGTAGGAALGRVGRVEGDALRTAFPLDLPPPLRALRLELRVEAPAALAQPPRWFGLGWAASFAVLLAAGLLLARGAAARIARPLEGLEAAAAAIAAEGTFARRVPERGTDEVARLARTFNRMLSALEDATRADRDALEARRLRTERALRLALLAVENAAEAMCVLDARGQVVFANEAAGPLLSGDGALAGGAPGAAPAGWVRLWEAVRAQGVVTEERAVRAPGGSDRWVELTARRLEADGEEYCFAVARDTSERHQAEAAARLAGVGTLAAGVAHEINNPLSYVLGNVAFVRDALARQADGAALPRAELDEAVGALDEAREGADRVRGIVQALRTFARPAARTAEPVDVHAAVHTAVLLTRNEVRHRARLELDLGPVPRLVGTQQRLEQVLVNLLVNAAQAIPEGHAEDHAVTLRVREDAGAVVIEVRDSGAGMTPEVRARVFEPFFTTKPFGGTGLGLSICHGIVSEMGGRVEVESAPGRGSTFRVTLPVAGAPAPARPPAPAPLPALPRARLLIVDDEPAVGAAVRRLLPPQVEAVVETSADAALARLGRGEPFDALLCDVMMPEMAGHALAREAAAVRPALAAAVLFMTGGAFTAEAEAAVAASGRPCLAKPFDRAALHAALAAVLAPEPGAATSTVRVGGALTPR